MSLFSLIQERALLVKTKRKRRELSKNQGFSFNLGTIFLTKNHSIAFELSHFTSYKWSEKSLDWQLTACQPRLEWPLQRLYRGQASKWVIFHSSEFAKMSMISDGAFSIFTRFSAREKPFHEMPVEVRMRIIWGRGNLYINRIYRKKTKISIVQKWKVILNFR